MKKLKNSKFFICGLMATTFSIAFTVIACLITIFG